VHPKGADSMAVSGLRFENALVGSEWAIAVLLCTRRVQTAWPSLGSALKTPWLALSGPLLSSYAQTG